MGFKDWLKDSMIKAKKEQRHKERDRAEKKRKKFLMKKYEAQKKIEEAINFKKWVLKKEKASREEDRKEAIRAQIEIIEQR